MVQSITGFHKDEHDEWVADLDCGHGQHMRHRPPWELRPWVLTEAGRATMLGRKLDCRKCDGPELSAAGSVVWNRVDAVGIEPTTSRLRVECSTS